jgi:ABC-2 type transport system ATP-binding protein
VSWGVTDLTVRYRTRPALDRVSLEVAAGSITTVVGGDGAGKSTLLRALAGGVAAQSGTVRRPAIRRIGYFCGTSAVYQDLTVTENLDFAAAAYRVATSARRGELLAAAGLTAVPHRPAGLLSGGMRSKLGLVMALQHNPDLLILDEPTTGIDPVSRTELAALISREAAGGTAVLTATTYIDEAERAGRVLVLDRGRALRDGAPDDIVAGVAGTVVVSPTRPAGTRWWRRGRRWHQWVPPGETIPAGATPAPVDLEDAVIIAALRQDYP